MTGEARRSGEPIAVWVPDAAPPRRPRSLPASFDDHRHQRRQPQAEGQTTGRP